MASFGTIYSIGTLHGDVYRSLPISMDDLIKSLIYDVMFEPGMIIHCRVLKNLRDNLILLAKYSSSVSLKTSTGDVEARLSKPLYLSTLFDSGIRLLKPYERPPRLI